jgi:ubiquinone/menaquinone biosynthesis C-methylase UbiE
MNTNSQGFQSNLIQTLFCKDIPLVEGVYIAAENSVADNQNNTNEAFTEKWTTLKQDADDNEPWKLAQFQWYLKLYGFTKDRELQEFVKERNLILDAGCGLGYKAAWFAKMNRNALVVAMDYSDSIFLAYERYKNERNMIFVKGDIADTPFESRTFDFINCDQVLHHTENPPLTCQEFNRILKEGGRLNTYVYAKKALPRELLDEHFRVYSKSLNHPEIWKLSEQLTTLGKTLSELNITIDVPDIPALNIKGGKQDLQRFIYWNFIKCFWNEEQGWDSSVSTNFDWYSPSNAFRYSQKEFISMLQDAGFALDYLHSEEACHSGRFIKF